MAKHNQKAKQNNSMKVINGNRQAFEKQTLLSVFDETKGDFDVLLKKLKPAEKSSFTLVVNDQKPDDQAAPLQVI